MFTKEFCNYIKGVSIFLIIMGHVVGFRDGDSGIFHFFKMLFYQGDCGVNAFFFLSAYGLCHSYKKSLLCQFYKKRVFRLFPVYLLFSIILFLLLPQVANSSIPRLLLMQISGITVFNGNKIVEWFIPALIVMYVTFPILYIVLNGMRRFRQYLLHYMAILGGLIPIFYLFNGVIHPFFLARWSAIFLGIMCYILSAVEGRSPLPLIIFVHHGLCSRIKIASSILLCH